MPPSEALNTKAALTLYAHHVFPTFTIIVNKDRRRQQQHVDRDVHTARCWLASSSHIITNMDLSSDSREYTCHADTYACKL